MSPQLCAFCFLIALPRSSRWFASRMQSTLVSLNAVAGGKGGANPKTTLYVGGLEENVNEAILHSAFIPFGEIKDVNIPLDHATGSICSSKKYEQVLLSWC